MSITMQLHRVSDDEADRRARGLGVGSAALAERLARMTDLGDVWLGLHVLLTGTADGGTPPLDFLLHGGTMLMDVDMGFGPARALRAADVQAVADALEAIDDGWLRERFRPSELARARVDANIDELIAYFGILRASFQRAAERGDGMLLVLG